MNGLYFDTETTGIANNQLPADHPSQPYLVQLAAVLLDKDRNERATLSMIVKPDGYTIPEGAAKVHGITTELAHKYGVPLLVAVAAFTNLRALADFTVCHNTPFDKLIMDAAIFRTGRKPNKDWPTMQCTMEMATPILNLPPTAKMKAAGYLKNKPPSLTETYKHFFQGETFDGAHDAMNDVRACIRVHHHMLDMMPE